MSGVLGISCCSAHELATFLCPKTVSLSLTSETSCFSLLKVHVVSHHSAAPSQIWQDSVARDWVGLTAGFYSLSASHPSAWAARQLPSAWALEGGFHKKTLIHTTVKQPSNLSTRIRSPDLGMLCFWTWMFSTTVENVPHSTPTLPADIKVEKRHSCSERTRPTHRVPGRTG